MTLAKTSDDSPFDQTDLRFAGDLARRCAAAIAKSILHSKTVDIASRFQEAALPAAFPKSRDWFSTASTSRRRKSCASYQSPLKKRSTRRNSSDPDPAGALIVADRLMRLDSDDDFSTALVAIIDPVHRMMLCASAGHPGPLMWTHDGIIATDGLLEWNRDVPAAWERLTEAMSRHDVRFARRPAAVIREFVIGGKGHADDVAILTLRVDGL